MPPRSLRIAALSSFVLALLAATAGAQPVIRSVPNPVPVTGARFGTAVAGLGDVNGDGYDDVVVGSPNGNRVDVFYGSAAGLSATSNWSGSSAVGYQYGIWVATAGDVNKDGYDELLVGQRGYYDKNPEADEGRVYMYYGSASGLSATPWTYETDVWYTYLYPCAGAGLRRPAAGGRSRRRGGCPVRRRPRRAGASARLRCRTADRRRRRTRR